MNRGEASRQRHRQQDAIRLEMIPSPTCVPQSTAITLDLGDQRFLSGWSATWGSVDSALPIPKSVFTALLCELPDGYPSRGWI